MKFFKAVFLVVAFVLFTTKSFAQFDDNLTTYMIASKFLLDKINVDPKITNALMMALPKIQDKDFQGVGRIIGEAFMQSKDLKKIDPQFVNYISTKAIEIRTLLTEHSLRKISSKIIEAIIVSDQYLNHNILPSNYVNNTSTSSNSNTISTSITHITHIDTNLINSEYDTLKIDRKAIGEKLKSIYQEKKIIRSIAFTPFGGCVVLYDKNSFWYQGIPNKLIRYLDSLHNLDKNIKYVSFNPIGGFVVLYGKKGFCASHLNPKLFFTLKELNKSDASIDHVGFEQNGGYVITYNKNKFESNRISDSLYKKLASISLDTLGVRQVSFDDENGYTIVYENGKVDFNNIQNLPKATIEKISSTNRIIKSISFFSGGGYAILASSNGYHLHYPKIYDKTLGNQNKILSTN